MKTVKDENEQINILRSRVIYKLIEDSAFVFWENYEKIMKGVFFDSLINNIHGSSGMAMDYLKKTAYDKIYSARSVIEIQVAGNNIIAFLLNEFIDALMNPDKNYYKQLLMLMPSQLVCKKGNLYDKIFSVVDFISGMTDIYSLELYRKIKGISFSITH